MTTSYHPSLPQVSVRKCANTACRKPGERCDPDWGRRSKAKPDWLPRMPWATPRGRRGKRRRPSSEQERRGCRPVITIQIHHAEDILLNVSHHLPNNDDFGSQLFVNGKDVNETDGEDHVVHAKDIPAKFIRPIEHPEHRAKDINYGNSII